MSWREPIAPEDEPDPVAELLKPRTWNEVWEDYIDEQIELGGGPEQFTYDFNLSEAK